VEGEVTKSAIFIISATFGKTNLDIPEVYSAHRGNGNWEYGIVRNPCNIIQIDTVFQKSLFAVYNVINTGKTTESSYIIHHGILQYVTVPIRNIYH